MMQSSRKRLQSTDYSISDRESSSSPHYILSHYLNDHQVQLEDTREFSLTVTNDISLACGEKINLPPEESEFACRLLSLERKSPPHVKCVEFYRESFNCLVYFESKIRSLLDTRMKALIFQNMDIQVYVMEESKVDGFMVHFQDKKKTKVSLDIDTFKKLIAIVDKIEQQYVKFKAKANAKKKKMNKMIANANCVMKRDDYKGIGRPKRPTQMITQNMTTM